MAINIKQALARATLLEEASSTPELDTLVLLGFVLQQSRAYLYTWPDRLLEIGQEKMFDDLLQRRITGAPIAHLTGEKEFWSLSLKVTADTLVPRPETELLVETALELFPADRPVKVLDLGTGTGAIALAIASERPDWEITGTDKSNAALKVAEENRQNLGLQNVTVVSSDWYSGLAEQRFHVIVSNPPYIKEEDPHLELGDVRFEPQTALIAGADGLNDIRTIITGATEYLLPGGWLMLEHGFEQGAVVRALFEEARFNEIETRKDLAGLDRMTLAKVC